MKNKFIFILLILFIFISILIVPSAYATNEDLDLSASSAILIDASTGKVLYAKNAYDKAYPASITKVLTAILTLENCKLDDIVIVSQNALDNIEFGYVTADLQVGEELTIEELLNILLVSSANDAALVLAEHISGNLNTFNNLMNQKAKEIGCLKTHFLNPNGVHDENHYSTAYDLALIGKYAMQFNEFKEIVTKSFYDLPPTNKNPETRIFYTTNELILSGSYNYYEFAIGIKTGFTTPAGDCLMSYSEKNNLPLIAVVLNSSSSDNRYSDIKKLFEYGNTNYYNNKIGTVGDSIQTINVKHATKETKKLNLTLDNDIYIVMNKNVSVSSLETNISINKNLKAPIHKGEVLGYIEYKLDGITYSSNLIASHNVKYSFMPWIFALLFLVVIIYFFVNKRNKRNKKSKKKYKNVYKF